MIIRTLILYLAICSVTNCWEELDVAGNDLSNPNAKFVEVKDGCEKSKKRKVSNYAALAPELDAMATTEDECFKTSAKTITEMPGKPHMRMLNRQKEVGKEKVEKNQLPTTECTEIISMEPKTNFKIETYTVPYTVTEIKYRTFTRKRKFIQRRRKIKRRMNKPIMVIRRRLVKERQTFERIIPKIIETREIINNPSVKYHIVEGPVEEVTKEPTTVYGIDIVDTECSEDEETSTTAWVDVNADVEASFAKPANLIPADGQSNGFTQDLIDSSSSNAIDGAAAINVQAESEAQAASIAREVSKEQIVSGAQAVNSPEFINTALDLNGAQVPNSAASFTRGDGVVQPKTRTLLGRDVGAKNYGFAPLDYGYANPQPRGQGYVNLMPSNRRYINPQNQYRLVPRRNIQLVPRQNAYGSQVYSFNK